MSVLAAPADDTASARATLAAATQVRLTDAEVREVDNLRRHLARLDTATPDDRPALMLAVRRSERIVAASLPR